VLQLETIKKDVFPSFEGVGGVWIFLVHAFCKPVSLQLLKLSSKKKAFSSALFFVLENISKTEHSLCTKEHKAQQACQKVKISSSK